MSAYKGLTLKEIISSLIDQNHEVDSKLLNIFLYTYRSYCEPWDVIELIDKRLNCMHDDPPEPTSTTSSSESIGFTKAIIIFFNSWLTIPFAYDFHELPHFRSLNHLLKKIREWPLRISFIQSSNEFRDSFKRLEETIGKVLISFNSMDNCERCDYRELPVDCQFRDSFAFNNTLKEDLNRNFFDFTPDTIALSLSYLDQQVLRKLRFPELVKHVQKRAAPSVTQIINNYNQLHKVVKLTLKQPSLAKKRFDQYQYSGRNSPMLLDQTNLSHESHLALPSSEMKRNQRHQVIEKWILVAQMLYQLRNFSSLVAILTALNSPELKSCMDILKIKKSTKLLNLYLSLLKVIEPYINQNKEEVLNGTNTSTSALSSIGFNYFSKNRNKTKNLRYHPTEIPYLGIFLRNMTYINEGFPDYVNPSTHVYNGGDNRIINLEKCRRQFDVMAQVRLFISSLTLNNIKVDESFTNWYFYLQTELRKSKHYSSDANLSSPTLSLESLSSFNSTDSFSATDNSSSSVPKPNIKPFLCMSQECLHSAHNRRRLQSSPMKVSHQQLLTRNRSVGANLSLHSNEPKVATVKLKEPRTNPSKANFMYQSNYFPGPKQIKEIRKPGTISNGAVHSRERQPLSNITRSSSSIDDKREERKSINLESILYKKIQIYENDRTTDFVDRVLKKFGKPNLVPNNFDVIQILDNGREILITFKAHLYYALAEKSEYLIEVRPKETT